jgi:hypothetical protein
MFCTTSSPHDSYHVPDCDVIWYVCPYYKLVGKFNFGSHHFATPPTNQKVLKHIMQIRVGYVRVSFISTFHLEHFSVKVKGKDVPTYAMRA